MCGLLGVYLLRHVLLEGGAVAVAVNYDLCTSLMVLKRATVHIEHRVKDSMLLLEQTASTSNNIYPLR